MKLSSVLALACGFTCSIVAADQLTINQVPDAVHNTIDRHRGKDQIKSINRKTENGKTVYDVEFSEPGLNPTLSIAQDGTILRENRPEPLTPDGVGVYPKARPFRSMALSDLPEPVKKTVNDKAVGRPISEIATEHWRGKTVYQIEFQQPGRNEQIHVAEDGTIFKDERFLSALGSVLKGTQLSDTPPSVQETARREAAGQKIKNVDTKRRNGEVVYEVDIEQPGKNFELSIAQDGTILRDSRKVESVGRPAASQLGFGGKELSLNDVPTPVQQRIKAQSDIGAGSLKSIREKTRDNRTVYDVEFEREGINKRMEIDATGAILKNNLPNQ